MNPEVLDLLTRICFGIGMSILDINEMLAEAKSWPSITDEQRRARDQANDAAWTAAVDPAYAHSQREARAWVMGLVPLAGALDELDVYLQLHMLPVLANALREVGETLVTQAVDEAVALLDLPTERTPR